MPDGRTRRDLPAVHALLDHPRVAPLIGTLGREHVVSVVRAVLDEARGCLARGEPAEIRLPNLAEQVASRLHAERPNLRAVLNASGILLHTGLGRAPLARAALDAVCEVARGYCNLELDLETGERGRRAEAVAPLLRQLTGAEAATVVNNNAGATVLALRATALGREVIVSRGQLIEIGGSFRLPEIMAVSGARMVEVGTTNRTRLADYERAITTETAALLRVHPSNYRVVGFTESVSIAELAALGRSRGLTTIDDIGSGAIRPGLPPRVHGEPTIAEGLSAGADLVLCSGDKLLGGPQCGLLLGRRAAVARVDSDPLMRALRVDKMTLAALEATLRLALSPEIAAREIPLWSFFSAPLDTLHARAHALADRLRAELGLTAEVVDSTAYPGGGSLPQEPLPSAAVRVAHPESSEADWARTLRLGDPPVIARRHRGEIHFDLRALSPDDDARLVAAVARSLGSPRS